MNVQRYDIPCQEPIYEEEDGEFVLYEDHKKIVDRLSLEV